MDREPETLITLRPVEARTAAALFERLFPADENGPGAREIGVVPYLDRALSGAYRDRVEDYRLGLAALDSVAREGHGTSFAGCGQDAQDAMISALESGTLHGLLTPSPRSFFEMVLAHLQEGLFADPAYGGNRDKLGWRFLGHPGVWLENSAEECLSEEPVTKGDEIRSLKDAGYSLGSPTTMPDEISGYDPQRSVDPPSGAADVVLVGVGGVGGLISPIFARAGLRVVALEAGPWRRARDFVPDELGSAYYCRGNMGEKFLGEAPRWRKNAGEPTREATFSLGRMMNGVGGSIIHYGAWLRRYHQHHFEHLTHVRERWGPDVLPEGSTLADWPVTYEDLEPYYTLLDRLVGVAGGEEDNPFIPRSRPYPMPPLRPCRVGEIFRTATQKMGLHPHPVPAGMNSEPYNGHPATTYTAWNLDLKTHCRVVRVMTDGRGHASGVEYVDPAGETRVQEARTVILCGYTFENVRLMLLSGDERHPDGLGNDARQVGRHFMTKMFAHVDGFFPDVVFNRHTGPAAQTMVLDDFLSEDLDYASNEFVGGATLGVENQLLPIQITRQDLPPDVPAWGKGYKDHIREWQHFCTVRIQPDTLSYENNFLDLDPRYRDRSGMPLVRITYDLRENEQRLAAWMEDRSEEILREMGATKTWRGPRFTGVGSSHDLGGCRMGEDPASSVVDPDLGVHDTPGLYVFGGAVFPTCPGVNPTHTLWALCYRAAERLSERLRKGEQR